MIYSKKLFGTAVIDNNDCIEIQKENDIQLEYYGTKNIGTTNLRTTKPYGIEVIKKEVRDEKLTIETKLINNICEKEHQTSKLLEILQLNKVTPICVDDVLQDLEYHTTF